MLEIANLTCSYDSGFAIRDINLAVQQGEIIGIIGPNGCGKTTLLRAITGILKPEQGKVLLKGQDMARMNTREIARKIAVVSQNSEPAFMTVEEFVLLGRIPHFRKYQFFESKEDREIAHEAMELTDSLRFKDHSVECISGGEQQLALFARALAQRPKMMLLDEPTSHLDITHQSAMLDLVRKFNRQFSLTVLLVLHDLNLASEYCHRLVLMNEGKVRKIGTPEEVVDYKIIEEVFKTIVVVEKNPLSSKPFVMIVSEEMQERSRTYNNTLP